jgi:hypothetical protein
MDLATPWLLDDVAIKLLSDGIQVANSEIHEPVRPGVAGVLRQEEAGTALTGDRHEDREAWLEAVFPFPGEAHPAVPGKRGLRRRDSQNWNGFLHDARMPDPRSTRVGGDDSGGVADD